MYKQKYTSSKYFIYLNLKKSFDILKMCYMVKLDLFFLNKEKQKKEHCEKCCVDASSTVSKFTYQIINKKFE